METIDITQEMHKTGNANYEITMTVNGGDPEVFSYENCNQIYPLYKSLMDTLRTYTNVNVNLKTDNIGFMKEISGVVNRHTTLFSMMQELKELNNISINNVK